MKNKKNIGIFGWKVGDNSFGITTSYYDYLNRFGDVYIISPLVDPDLSILDLVVIPGGPDISPISYAHVPNMSTGRPDPIKEYFDTYIVPKVTAAKIPIFGICRGHQALAVLHGASLIQHMHHETSEPMKRFELVHEVNIDTHKLPYKSSLRIPKNSMMANISVNSLHHQVVSNNSQLKALEKEGVVSVIAKHKSSKNYEDTHIEALYYPGINSISVQWHPEEIYDAFSEEAINYLLSLTEKTESENEDNTSA